MSPLSRTVLMAEQMPELLEELRAEWDRYASEVGVVLIKN
jgi:hypothetical protein